MFERNFFFSKKKIDSFRRLIEESIHSFCNNRLRVASRRCLKGARRRTNCGVVGETMWGGWKKGAGGGECRERLLTSSRIRSSSVRFVSRCRGTCAMHRECQSADRPVAPPRARARATCIPIISRFLHVGRDWSGQKIVHRWNFNEFNEWSAATPRSPLSFLLFSSLVRLHFLKRAIVQMHRKLKDFEKIHLCFKLQSLRKNWKNNVTLSISNLF